jgi:hypothetical protein
MAFCGNGPHTDSSFIASSLLLRKYLETMQLLINVFDCFVISCFLYLLVVFRDHRRRRGLPYPPGPPSRPIIGNLLDFPKDMPWSAYAKMSKKHGMCIILETLVLPSSNPHSKATLSVFAFFLRSSSCCAHYQPLRISSRSEGKSTRIGLPCQSRKCTSCFPIGRHVDNPSLSLLGRTWIGRYS